MSSQINFPGRRALESFCLVAAIAVFVTARPLGTGERPPFVGRLAPIPNSLDGHAAAITEISGKKQLEHLIESTDSTTAGLHRAGLDALEAFSYDKAVFLLSQAATLDPRSARLSNDLAVAYLERGIAQGNAVDLFYSLARSTKAIRLDRELEHAVFNRAAALEYLSLDAMAENGWTSLTHAHDRHLAHLAHFRLATGASKSAIADPEQTWESPLAAGDVADATAWVANSPDEVRQQIETAAWADWATALRSDPGRASARLDHLIAVGRALRDRYGDLSVSSRVEQLSATLHARPSQEIDLAKAIQAYSETFELFDAGRFEDAERRFEDALLLDSLGGPWRSWYRLQQARQRGARFEYRAALDLLKRVIHYAESKPDPILLAESLTLANNFHLTLGEPSAALAASERAHPIFLQYGAPMRAARVRALHAFALEHQGQMDEAWAWLSAGLRELDGQSEFRAKSALFVCGAWLANAASEPDLALFFQNQFIETAVATERPDVVASALRVGAQIQYDLDMPQQARESLTQAQTWAAQIDDDLIALAVEADLLLVEASTLSASKPEQARQLIARAIDSLRSTSFPYRLAEAYRAEAGVLLALDQPGEAERSLKAALSEVERQRRLIARPADRVLFLDQRRALLDTMVALQLDHLDKPSQALAYSDLARANVLRDWIAERRDGTKEAPASRFEMSPTRLIEPYGPHVVAYAVLDQRTIVWVQAPATPLVTEVIDVGRNRLEVLTERWVQSLRVGDEKTFRDLGRELHRLLVTPIESALGPRGSALTVVPDGPIHKLPFPLLRHPIRDRPLLDDHAVVIAPSLTDAYRNPRATVPSTSWQDSNLLMVVAPTRDKDWSTEALEIHPSDQKIASSFRAPLLLEGRNATKSRFSSHAPSFDIVYFGGHSVVDREAPMRSHMLFAQSADDSDSGILTAGEILDLDLSRARVVVLASCGSGDGRLSRTEGVESLARPFLAAGANHVIASLWRVEDDTTAKFFAQFFQTLLDTPDLAQALRRTQRELAQTEPDEIETWGAFLLISGRTLRRAS